MTIKYNYISQVQIICTQEKGQVSNDMNHNTQLLHCWLGTAGGQRERSLIWGGSSLHTNVS